MILLNTQQLDIIQSLKKVQDFLISWDNNIIETMKCMFTP